MSIIVRQRARQTIQVPGGPSAPPPPSWTPANASVPLWCWYDPFVQVTQGAGIATAMADNSGNADPNRDQTTAGGTEPVYTASDVNFGGKPTLSGAGTKSMSAVGAASASATVPISILVVGNVLADVSSLFCGDVGKDMIYRSGGNLVRAYSTGSLLGGPCDIPSAVLFTDDGTGAPDAAKIYVNDLTTPENTDVTFWQSTDTYNVMLGTAGVGKLDGAFACMAVWEGVLTPTDISNLKTFLNVTRAYGIPVT